MVCKTEGVGSNSKLEVVTAGSVRLWQHAYTHRYPHICLCVCRHSTYSTLYSIWACLELMRTACACKVKKMDFASPVWNGSQMEVWRCLLRAILKLLLDAVSISSSIALSPSKLKTTRFDWVGRCRLDTRNNLFSQGVVQHWNRLPRQVVELTHDCRGFF